MTTPAHTRAVAEVLAEHQSRPTGSPFCRCGWRPSMFLNDTESDRLQHVAHQADMLAAAGLLADPARDAQVLRSRNLVAAEYVAPMLARVRREGAAKALRDAIALRCGADARGVESVPARWLEEMADRIEREDER